MKRRVLTPLLLALLGAGTALADIVPPKPQLADIVLPKKQPADVVPVKPEPTAATSFDPAPFTHSREVAPAPPGGGLCALAADPDLYRFSGERHEGLRLVKRNGESLTEIPWVMRRVHVPAAPRDERLLLHRVESFDEKSDGSIEITVTLEAGSVRPVRLEIDTPLRDFEKGVTVSVRGDDGTWTNLVGDGVIFDHSRFLDFRHTGLTLPATAARQFRIRVSDATDEQRSLVKQISRTVGDHAGLSVSESGTVTNRTFRIDALRFLSAPVKSETGERGRHSLELATLEPPVTEEGETRLVLDGGNVPLDRFLLATGDRNFRRAVSVQVPDSNGAGGWRTVHRAFVYRYDVGGFHDESLALTFREVRAERIRLLVENGDNSPLKVGAVSGSGPAHEVVFIAEGGEPHVLYLGSSEALTKPSLDTAAIEAALARGFKAEPLALGTLTDNPRFRTGGAPAAGKLLESKAALWTVIAIAVSVLIAVLYRALRQIEGVGENS